MYNDVVTSSFNTARAVGALFIRGRPRGTLIIVH